MTTPLSTHAWNCEIAKLENLGDYPNAREAVRSDRYTWPDEHVNIATASREQKQRFLLAVGVPLDVDQNDDWIDAAVRTEQEKAPAGETTPTEPVGEDLLLQRQVPFGFRRDANGTLVEDPKEHPVLGRIKRMNVAGSTPRVIAEKLCSEGFKINTVDVRAVIEGATT